MHLRFPLVGQEVETLAQQGMRHISYDPKVKPSIRFGVQGSTFIANAFNIWKLVKSFPASRTSKKTPDWVALAFSSGARMGTPESALSLADAPLPLEMETGFLRRKPFSWFAWGFG